LNLSSSVEAKIAGGPTLSLTE